MYTIKKAALFIKRDLVQARRFLEIEDIEGFTMLYLLRAYGSLRDLSTHDIGEVKKLIRQEVGRMIPVSEIPGSNNYIGNEDVEIEDCNKEIIDYISDLYLKHPVPVIYSLITPAVSEKYFHRLLIDCFGRKGKGNTWGDRIVLDAETAKKLPKYARYRAMTVGVSKYTLKKYGLNTSLGSEGPGSTMLQCDGFTN